jgi:transcriptional regulator with XRE-family HTH domain
MRNEFGAVLRARRHELGLTQEELSARTGVAQMTISSVETGSSTPRVDILLKLCLGLGVSPNWVLQEAGLLPREGEGGGSEEFWELWSVMERLGPAERQDVLRFARYREWEGR